MILLIYFIENRDNVEIELHKKIISPKVKFFDKMTLQHMDKT